MRLDRALQFWQSVFYYSPAAVVVGIWAIFMLAADRFFIFAHYWPLSLTMVFGSFIAGATSEGGAAVAFPIFTKLFHVPPDMARTFGLAIQTVGMGVAAVTIVKQKIPISRRALLYSSLGGVLGITAGTFVISPILPGAYSKIAFTLLATGFGVALLLDNRSSGRRLERLPGHGRRVFLVLAAAGMVGGVFTSIVGAGIDIVTFSILVMRYNLSEKVATPTSVILMAVNSAIGFLFHVAFTGGFNQLVMDYWLCCVPVVIFGAPLGAVVCARVTRRTVVRFLLALIGIELVSTLILVHFDLYARIFAPVLLAATILFFRKLRAVREVQQR
ncbi:MAG: sulfite exporter TauE/SafE family protein [bacterium]|nr:sulfite exporter TauE/SafE family protein [bacterium]